MGILDLYKKKIEESLPSKIFIKVSADDGVRDLKWDTTKEPEVEPTSNDLDSPDIETLNLMREPHVAWIYKNGKLYYMKSDEVTYDHAFIASKYGVDFNHERDPAGRISLDKSRLGVWWYSALKLESPNDEAILALYNDDLIGLSTKVQYADGETETVHELLKEITNKDEDTGFSAYSRKD